MAANKALVSVASGQAAIVDVPYPVLPRDDYIIVRTTAVAVNPTDWNHIDKAEGLGCLGCQVGCDYAGVVELVGPKVTKPFKKGDRICGPVNGSNGLRKEDGTFANYIAVKGDLQIPIPENISDEEAATLGISITTTGQGLYQTLGLPLPGNPSAEKTPILIYGGSTATGIYGIQFAKLSGYTVIVTASPHNEEYLRSLGADHVVDYKSADAVAAVRAAAGGDLRLAWDCHSTPESAVFCARALNEDDVHYSALKYVQAAVLVVNPKATVDVSLYYTVFGEDFMYGEKLDAVPKNYEFGKTFWELSRELLAAGKVKPIRVSVNRGGSGLEGVLVGLNELREGKVSGEKLVYTL
ncbi:related to toxD gene [Cephalotrichum gorgonifer]|uniref:Related to toxD protein n=1 Tax=Cephalotrichum gorgonifer TaxID=2041049 RepID=A0AAE8SQY8_9PEZI|nr:related to toxD gene [Cephalotrichum gorgonifer]